MHYPTLVLLALPTASALVLAPSQSAPLNRRVVSSPRLSVASTEDTPPAALEEPPSLATLEAWTREYYNAAKESRIVSGESMDGFLERYDWFADDYVLTGPDIGPLCKSDYVATQRGFTLDFGAAAPDLTNILDGFHVDVDNPYRVWFTNRYVGTHTGTTRLSKYVINPTGNEIRGGPELHSIWWTPDKQIKWETVGYCGCKYTGTNEGFGGLAGMLVPMGVPRAFFDAFSPFAKIVFGLSQFNEASETGGRARSPESDLPRWWQERTALGINVRR